MVDYAHKIYSIFNFIEENPYDRKGHVTQRFVSTDSRWKYRQIGDFEYECWAGLECDENDNPVNHYFIRFKINDKNSLVDALKALLNKTINKQNEGYLSQRNDIIFDIVDILGGKEKLDQDITLLIKESVRLQYQEYLDQINMILDYMEKKGYDENDPDFLRFKKDKEILEKRLSDNE